MKGEEKPPGRPYRVLKRLPWIEGGRPAPAPEFWEGGEGVIYEPGDTIYLHDEDLKSLYHKLEAMDDAGRALLEEARAKAEGPAKRTPLADFTQDDVELVTNALYSDEAMDARRRAYGPHRIERDFAVLRDGSEVPLPTRYIPIKPLPGVVYGDDGLPDAWATARQRERLEKDRKLARIRNGASLGGRRGRESKRETAASSNGDLLADVQAYRAKHPSHGRPAIAKALVDEHGSIRDHADPRGREKAIDALRKRIERLEKSLDT